MSGLRWALCLAAASHVLGFTAPLTDFGQRRLVIFYAGSLSYDVAAKAGER